VNRKIWPHRFTHADMSHTFLSASLRSRALSGLSWSKLISRLIDHLWQATQRAASQWAMHLRKKRYVRAILTHNSWSYFDDSSTSTCISLLTIPMSQKFPCDKHADHPIWIGNFNSDELICDLLGARTSFVCIATLHLSNSVEGWFLPISSLSAQHNWHNIFFWSNKGLILVSFWIELNKTKY
jgi:hypothetical protein